MSLAQYAGILKWLCNKQIETRQFPTEFHIRTTDVDEQHWVWSNDLGN